MAPIGTFWGDLRQVQTKTILSVAAIAQLELEVPPFEYGVTNKSPEFLEKFPHGKIPAFEDKEGFKLVEGTVIARYLSTRNPDSGLLGKGRDAKQVALVDQWVHFAEHEISVPLFFIIRMLYFGDAGVFNRQHYNHLLDQQHRSLRFLEAALASSSSGFLVHDEISLADLVVAAIVQRAGAVTLGPADRALYPLVFALHAKVSSDPRLKEIFGDPGFVEVAMKEPQKAVDVGSKPSRTKALCRGIVSLFCTRL